MDIEITAARSPDYLFLVV